MTPLHRWRTDNLVCPGTLSAREARTGRIACPPRSSQLVQRSLASQLRRAGEATPSWDSAGALRRRSVAVNQNVDAVRAGAGRGVGEDAQLRAGNIVGARNGGLRRELQD